MSSSMPSAGHDFNSDAALTQPVNEAPSQKLINVTESHYVASETETVIAHQRAALLENKNRKKKMAQGAAS